MKDINHQGSTTQINRTNNFRKLPCKTFISTGTCPYGNKCKFIHDPRFTTSSWWSANNELEPKLSNTSNQYDYHDLFFWKSNTEFDGPYRYDIPFPENSTKDKYNDYGTYSMYQMLKDFLLMNHPDVSWKRKKHTLQTTMNSMFDVNVYSGLKRLDCFVQLSKNKGTFYSHFGCFSIFLMF